MQLLYWSISRVYSALVPLCSVGNVQQVLYHCGNRGIGRIRVDGSFTSGLKAWTRVMALQSDSSGMHAVLYSKSEQT